MAAAAPALRSSAWASLLQEQRVEAPAAAVREGLARAREECRSARAEMAATFAAADRARPTPTWLREWVTCLDDLLALAERLHAHVEALPAA